MVNYPDNYKAVIMSDTLVLTSTSTPESSLLSIRSRPEQSWTDLHDTHHIIYNDCTSGLKVKVIGGRQKDDGSSYGIYVRRIYSGGVAALDGRLLEGDQLLQVNGASLENVTNERAVYLLRQATESNSIELVVNRSQKAREEYSDLLETASRCTSSASSVIEPISRTQTPALLDPELTHRQHPAGSPSPSTSPGQHLASPDTSTPSGSGNEAGEIGEIGASMLQLPPGGASVDTQMLNVHGHPSVTPASVLRTNPGLLMVPSMTSTPQGRGNVQLSPSGAAGDASGSSGLREPSSVMAYSSNHQGALSHDHHGASSLAHQGAQSYNSLPRRTSPSIPPPSFNSLPRRTSPNNQQQPRTISPSLQNRKLSLDSNVRIRVEKLEVALRYLGIDPQPEQQKILRDRLSIDEKNTVPYGEFVKAAREIFRFQLEEHNLSPGAKFRPSGDIKDFTDPPAFAHQGGVGVLEMSPSTSMEQVIQERDLLRHEVAKLQRQLHEKDQICRMAEDELLRVRREAQGVMMETRSLRSKVHLAAQAQKAARSVEHDYEEVVRLLESELSDLRSQQAKQLESPAVQKRLTVLGSQLKKTEVSKKRYEVATEKLLKFAENVQESLIGVQDVTPSSSGPKKSKQRFSPQQLAGEARQVTQSVRTLIEEEPLPFGWDVAYTEDGMKYYINHVTQITTWTHPVSQVQTTTPASTPRSPASPQHQQQGASS